MAFHACTFTFDGISSANFGLWLMDIDGAGQSDPSIKMSIVEDKIPRRVRPLHYAAFVDGALEFDLTFGATDYGLDSFDVEKVASWLYGHSQYKKLTIDQPELDGIYFRAIITTFRPITSAWYPVAFSVHVRCDGAYAYTIPYKDSITDGTVDYRYLCDTSRNDYYAPKMRIKTSGPSVSIKNKEDGDMEFLLSNLPSADAGYEFEVDNENGIIVEKNGLVNPYKYFNWNFFRALRGDNHLTVVGGDVEIISEFPRIVLV